MSIRTKVIFTDENNDYRRVVWYGGRELHLEVWDGFHAFTEVTPTSRGEWWGRNEAPSLEEAREFAAEKLASDELWEG